MVRLPPIRCVPMFVRCRWCEGVFRADTTWPDDPRTVYRRCAWCSRLTRLPTSAFGAPIGPAKVQGVGRPTGPAFPGL